MSPPPDVKHVELPNWFGLPLANGRPGEGAADALAAGSDLGDVIVDDRIPGTDAAFDGYGAAGTALATYEKSLFDEAYLYGGSDVRRQLARLAEAGLAGVLDWTVGKITVFGVGGFLPFLDVLLKPVARKFRVSLGETVLDGLRTTMLAVAGRPEDLARLRARAQMGEMSRAADWVVTVYDDGVAQTFERLIAELREPLRPDEPDDTDET